jgi:hypothetical protein
VIVMLQDCVFVALQGWVIVCLFVCLFTRVPEGRMTVVSSRSHASCRVLGQNPPRGPIKSRVTQMAYVF